MSELVIPERGAALTAAGLVVLERQVADQLAAVEDIETLEEWRAQARALEGYLRDKELQGPMLGIQRRAEARIGELLGEAKRGGKAEEQLDSRMSESLPRPDDRADFRVLRRALNGCPLTDEEWRKSRRALVALIRRRTGDRPETKPLPEGRYSLIVADPPWRLDTGPDAFGTTGERGHDDLAYEQMSVADIEALPVADRAADDAHLYLWTTNRYVEAAYSVARAWGFKPSVLLVWAKSPRGVGLGDAYKLTTEFIVYARRGTLREADISETTWFNWPRSKHSVKPAAFYELVEQVSPAEPGARLELFARSGRPGWKPWGHEAPDG
ncbi:MAG: MT-A70 family methyltransferase [Solirubrobacteraceae bacterium]